MKLKELIAELERIGEITTNNPDVVLKVGTNHRLCHVHEAVISGISMSHPKEISIHADRIDFCD